MKDIRPPARHQDKRLAPAGEPEFMPFYDARLRWPVRRAWLQLAVREGVQTLLGMPLEHFLLRLWLERLPGHQTLERLGLPRRALEQALGGALTLDVAPRALIRSTHWSGYPRNKRPSSTTFIWDGEWDQYRGDLRISSRYCLISELAAHRDALTDTWHYQKLAQRVEEGRPWQSHQKGVLLDTDTRIIGYLRTYLGFLDDMAAHGFDTARGKDALGVAVTRDGRLLKINRGFHRLAMAQYLGLESVPVQVRAVHREWWQRVVGDADGVQALGRVREALGECLPETRPGSRDPAPSAQDFHWPAP